MNRAIFTILFVPVIFLKTLSAQPSPEEIAKLFQRDMGQSPQSDFSKIDNYVLGLKPKKNITEAELAKLITQQSQTRMEKARAIFIWIADNIAYDTDRKITSKEEAFKKRKGVCEAYSGLFKSLGELVGLEVITISGDTKQIYYKRPSDLDKGGHAWNVFKDDDGRRVIVDATWGAGYMMNKKFTRQLTLHWFDPQPEIFIFTHFPKEVEWQLLKKPVLRDEFLRIPPLSPALVTWGFNAGETLSYFIKTKDAWFPDQFTMEMNWKINMMPVCKELKARKSYDFEFILPQNEEVVIIHNKSGIRFNRDGDKISVTFTPETKGQAILALKLPNGKFSGIFQYDVK